ncbi:SRPBCC domain-containing protein [Klugiella xanthotipulae]|nr:SRPBCC domain-containing protein [Klugiella xanthotipulae]
MDPIIYVIYIAATPERVWRAFVDDVDVRAVWWGCVLRTTLQPGTGYEYVGPGADGDETVHVWGDILEATPGERLVMTEHPGPSYNPEGAERSSRMVFTMDAVTSHLTKLTVLNDQWSEAHPGYEETKDTWPLLMSSIKSYVETGSALSFEE